MAALAPVGALLENAAVEIRLAVHRQPWERGARFAEVFLVGPTGSLDDAPAPTTQPDPASGCVQLSEEGGPIVRAARGAAYGPSVHQAPEPASDAPGTVRLSLGFAGRAPVGAVLQAPGAFALGVDLYVVEALDPADAQEKRVAWRRRATATFFAEDLAVAEASAPLADFGRVRDPEQPALRAAQTTWWGSVVIRRTAPFVAGEPAARPRTEALHSVETRYEASAQAVLTLLCADSEQKKYERSAEMAGHPAASTRSHMASPFNFSGCRRGAATPGMIAPYGAGTPARFRAEAGWLRQQLTVAFARHGLRVAPLMPPSHAAAVVLAEACCAWLTAHPYLADRDASDDGAALVDGDTWFNPFVQGGFGDCEDTNGAAVNVWRHFALRAEFAAAEEPDPDWRAVLNSARELAALYVPFLCTGASHGAYAKATDDMRSVSLDIHMYGVVLPMHAVAGLCDGVPAFDVEPLLAASAATRAAALQSLVLECTGWVSPHGGALELSASRDRAETSLATQPVVELRGAMRLCIRHSFFDFTAVRGVGARPSRRMHLMVTTLMTDQLLRLGALRGQTYGASGLAWLGFRLSPDAGERTWSVETSALWDDALRGTLRLYPVFDAPQEDIREATLAERPPPLMRFSREADAERTAATCALVAALAEQLGGAVDAADPGLANVVPRPLSVAERRVADLRGHVTPVLVQQWALEMGERFTRALAERLKSLNVAAVAAGPGTAHTALLLLYHAPE